MTDGEYHHGESIDWDRSTHEYGAEPYKDPMVLERLYHEQDKSLKDIGDIFNIGKSAVQYWFDKFGIERDAPKGQRKGDNGVSRCQYSDFRAQYYIDNHGGSGEDKTVRLYENRIVALEDHHPGAVGRGEVDHLMASPLKVNIPMNLQPRVKSEHGKRHKKGNSALPPVELLGWLFGTPDTRDDPDFETVLSWFWEWGQTIESDGDDRDGRRGTEAFSVGAGDD